MKFFNKQKLILP